MPIEETIERLRLLGRVRTMQRLCRIANVKGAVGWTGFQRRVEEEEDAYLPLLQGHLLDSILFGRKSVALLRLNDADRQALLAADAPVLPDDLMPVVEGLEHALWIVDSADARTFVMRGPRQVVRREPIPAEELSEEARERLGEGAHVVATIRRDAPGFDVLEVPRATGDQLIELRLGSEFGDDFRLVGNADDLVWGARLRLGAVINPAAPRRVGQVVDLFPAVAQLRREDRDHELVDMTFESADGYSHRGRSPRAGGDLSDDGYHGAGEEASELHAYSVAARWEQAGRTLKVELKGRKKMLMMPAGELRLRRAVIHAQTAEDFQAAVGHLRAHLG